jgi:hypothetical protein
VRILLDYGAISWEIALMLDLMVVLIGVLLAGMVKSMLGRYLGVVSSP